jgi:Kef-type K+ transport system membrane component KefB
MEALLLLSICVGAFVMPLLSRRLHLPGAVGEILYGLFIGVFFGDVFHQTPVVKFLGEFGFIILMYLAGLEINFQKIRQTRRTDILLYCALFVVVVAGAFYAVAQLGQPVIFALVYLTTAVGLLFPVLKETGLIRRDAGQSLLIIGSIGEIFSLLFITGFVLYFKFGLSRESFIHLLEVIVFLVVAYMLLKLFQLLIWWYPNLRTLFLTIGDSSESGIRANFVNIFVFVALASLVNLELIVGAFLGGMLFALVFKEREHIMQRIGAFGYGFLIPIFFIEVGLQFNVRDFFHVDVLRMAALLTAVIFILRLAASVVLFLSGLSWRLILLVPFATSFALTLLIATAALGLELDVLDQTQASAILMTAILTSLIFPALMRLLVRRFFAPTPGVSQAAP